MPLCVVIVSIAVEVDYPIFISQNSFVRVHSLLIDAADIFAAESTDVFP